MLRVFSRCAGVLLATALVGAQAITNVIPTIGSFDVTFGGANTSVTITGTGFLTTPKGTRFVDLLGNDVFSFVSCSTSTTCSGTARAGLKAAGQAGNIAVKALTSGGTSPGSINFFYYGVPTVTSIAPNTTAFNTNVTITVTGAGFAGAAGFPGISEINRYPLPATMTCTTSTTCTTTSGVISTDCCIIQGARDYSVTTPGGIASAFFTFGTLPNTPTITSVTPASGSTDGGNVLTITGTNFIAGGQTGIGGFGVKAGTNIFFDAPFNSFEGTGVSCASTTTCTVTAPPGSAGQSIDIRIYTICPANSSVPGCGGANPRPANSVAALKKGAYVYAGMRTNPPATGQEPFLYTSENGRSATFTVQLTTQPTAAVHVALASTVVSAGTVSPAGGLDFTTANWASPQTVTVTGLDVAGVGSTQYNVSLAATSADPKYNNLNQSSQSIFNIDNDSSQVLVSPSQLTVTRGGAATFQVVLSKQPLGTVTVNLTSSDTTMATLTPAPLTFDTTSTGAGNSWNATRTVTVTGLNDSMVGIARPFSIIVAITAPSDTAVNGYGDPNRYYPDILATLQDAPPAITAHPSNTTVAPSATASFTANATGAPAPTVQWQVAASAGAAFVDVPTLTTPTIFVMGQLVDNGKQYRAVFTNAGGSTATNAATLTVAAPAVAPTVTLNPAASTTVLTGTTIFFGTTATGSPAPTVQWQVSTNGGSSWSNIGGATGPNISFAAQRFDNGKQYRAVYTNGSGIAITSAVSLFVRLRVRSDIENDRKADLVNWRPSDGKWYWLTSSTLYNYANQGQKQWGSSAQGDIPISADMDGDGIMDLIVWRPTTGTFFWLTSTSGFAAGSQRQWGNNALGDKPFVGDLDGDGKGDLIVWRPGTGTWFYLLSSAAYSVAAQGQNQWGNASLGDQPLVGDFDGDGRTDLGVWRASTGTWFWLTSTSGFDPAQSGVKQWGNSALGDTPLVSDMDGDGVSDLVVWRSSDATFYWLTSLSGFDYAAQGQKQWGSQALNDIPMLGDLDGDGGADLIVFRPSSGTWFWLTSSSGYSYAAQLQKQWGASGDIPMIK